MISEVSNTDKAFNIISVAAGLIGGALTALLGGFDAAFRALIIIMALDYLTGVIKAVYTKTLSSEIGYKGLIKKALSLVIVALANAVQQTMGGGAIREIVIMFYVSNEGISVLENVAAISPDMPERLRDILLQLRSNKR